MRSAVMNYENYTKLIDSLQEKPLAPMSIEETMIRKKFDKLSDKIAGSFVKNQGSSAMLTKQRNTDSQFKPRIRWNVVVYSTSVMILLTSVLATSIFKDFETKELSFRIWIPWDHSSFSLFTIAYVYLYINFVVTSFANVSCDSLFSGLLIHTCSQLEILRHRLRHVKRNGDYSAEHCARLHNRIYKLSLEIPDMIMESDWTSLDTGARKTFLIIMYRATMPIEFRSAHIATMNLDSFMAVSMNSTYVLHTLLSNSAQPCLS
ncbi:uncharacterized protein LOC143348381 [Colletes latitarsis]|uniref:uncharacterized protein LOC143348381 n=1 Tax=Colletes latitarsis TaxID=2605962 RepID=UPI004035A11E